MTANEVELPRIESWEYLTEYKRERAQVLAAVERVLESGVLILGESVRSFEREFAQFHDVAECVGVDNCTNALSAALQAYGIGPGDEVITVANTAAATVVAIDSIGARTVFVDVCPETYLMDVGRLRDAITARTRCILPVHLYGQCVDMDPLLSLGREEGLLVLEDCAQAHAARYRGRLAGSLGQISAFSFYPTKIMGGFGDAGAVLCKDPEIARAIRRSRFYGMEPAGIVHSTPARNCRMDELHAEILRFKLSKLSEYVSARRAIAARYRQGLADCEALVLPKERPECEHAYYMFVVRHPRRDQILAFLKERGISLSIHYEWPIHGMPGFAHLGQGLGTLPETEKAAKEVFSLPMYPTLSLAAQQKVMEMLKEAVQRV